MKTSATGEQAEVKGFEDDRKKGDNDSDNSAVLVSGENPESQLVGNRQ